jgi:hypothetical protein
MAAGLLALSLSVPQSHADLPSVVTELLVTIVIGAVLYLGTSAMLWQLAGRSDGPEREVVEAAFRALVRIRRPEATGAK